MIDRYSREEMARIWRSGTRFYIWFLIEAHAGDAMANLRKIPRKNAEAVWKAGTKLIEADSKEIKKIRSRPRIHEFRDEHVDEIEELDIKIRHDIIAFLTHLAEQAGGETARFVHQGMTSSDVLDTCLAVQLKWAADLLIKDIGGLLEALKERAFEHKNTPRMGRSHGIHAEPVTMGLTFARFYAEMQRNLRRLKVARKEIATGAISGAVGTFANVDPRVEAHVCAKMGLKPEPISTQVIPRDRHAAFFAALGVVASSVENVAVEIRHMQRTEVLEAQEFFAPKQKGSSAMPHKRNPILSENLTGLARLVRMAVVPAMENVALWHERDISHSSVERVISPDATIALDFALVRLTSVIERLVVHPKNMKANMRKLSGLHMSQEVLLALTQAGASREDAYAMVQRCASEVWDKGADFRSELLADKQVTKLLPRKKINECLDPKLHKIRVDEIFERVFGKA